MKLKLNLIVALLALLFLSPETVRAGSYAQDESDAPAKLERLMLQRQHAPELINGGIQKLKNRWLKFRDKQANRPLLDRMLRYCLLCLIAAIIFGLLAAPLSNIAAFLGTAMATLGGLASLGALIFFIFWVMEQV